MKDVEPALELPVRAHAAAQAVRTPRALLVATMPWMFHARLASALRRAGFHVEAVCQITHPLRHLAEPIATHRLAWVEELASIETAIERADPDLVIPGDDPAVSLLHHLHGSSRLGRVKGLIEQSLGDPAGFSITAKRSAFVALAHSMGLSAPRSKTVAGRRALATMADHLVYPCVLKRDQTWSGIGTAVVKRASEIDAAWSWIAGWLSVLRAAKAAYRDRRPNTLLDLCSAESAAVEVQEYVPGLPANRAVVCRGGKVLAGLNVVAVHTAYAGGPASVVRVIDHPQMTEVADALVARLGLSGFCGFDFMIDASGQAFLLELNPRATPICHLPLADGTHLPSALYRDVGGREPASVPRAVTGNLVALFPTEWQRDRSSTFLHQAHHDVPWDEPGLLDRAGFAHDVTCPTTSFASG